MGIEGLLPMIKDILIPVNVKLFRESTVGMRDRILAEFFFQ